MKKLMKVMVLALILTVATACGGGAKKEEIKKDVKLAVVIPDADHGFTGALVQYAKEDVKRIGNDAQVYTSSDSSAQINQMDTLITNKVKVIVLFPHDGKELTGAIEKATKAGVKVVVFDRGADTKDYETYIHGDNVGIGREAAKYFNEKLGSKDPKNIVIIDGLAGITVTEERNREFLKNLNKNIKVVAQVPADFQSDKALIEMTNILTAQKKIDAVYTHDDDMAEGVLKAVQEQNRKDVQFITGVAGSKAVLKTIMDDDSQIKATFYFSPKMIVDAIKVGEDLLKGTAPKSKETIIPTYLIDQAKAKEMYNADAPF